MSETSNKGLLSCRCIHCGAPIEISPDVEIVKCEYCDTSFRVEKATKEEVIINNIQNINIEKKGFGQAAIEFLDRRAEAYEKAVAEERARQAEREARKRKILLTIGKVFLRYLKNPKNFGTTISWRWNRPAIKRMIAITRFFSGYLMGRLLSG